jgi:hypothetical protein
MEKPQLQLGDDNQAVEPMGSFAMLHVENAKCEACRVQCAIVRCFVLGVLVR